MVALRSADGSAPVPYTLPPPGLGIWRPTSPSSAAAEVLTKFFGQHAAFSTTSTSLPGVVRSYASFWDAAREVSDARVFGGIHFRRTCVLSNEIGKKIGKFAFKNYLRPIGCDRDDDCDDLSDDRNDN